MNQVGFVGAGNIGAPMARSLLRGHLKVKVCDASERVTQEFQRLGCETTRTASDLADSWAIVIMVNTADQLMEALFGADGLAAGFHDDVRPLVIVTSTILPVVIEDVAGKVAALGARMIDAPVSGGPIPAEEGKLTIMVGGDPADIEAARPILELLGRVIVCGALGAGQKTKIINNLVGVTNQLLMGEALALAAACGLDRACLLSVMDCSSGRNYWSRDWALTQCQYAEYAQVADDGLCIQRSLKDLQLALRFAGAAHADMPLLKAVAVATGQRQDDDIARQFRSIARVSVE